MRLHRIGVGGLLVGVLWTVPALAESAPTTSFLTGAIRSNYLRFDFHLGRITCSGRLARTHSSTSSGSRSERLSIQASHGQPLVSYRCSTGEEELTIDVSSGDRIQIRRVGKDDSPIVPVRFTQTHAEPISLVLGPDGRQVEYRAASLWHLLIAQPEECQQHLTPLLKRLLPDWNLAESAAAVEEELLRAAGNRDPPDGRRWATLVRRLADDRFGTREVADRELRAVGITALSYLRQLDFDRLDAEQQYRLRRIIRSLGPRTVSDTPSRVVGWLMGDPQLWLIFLARPQPSQRRLAARQLSALLGHPIALDPDADFATRKTQIERLRTRIERERWGSIRY